MASKEVHHRRCRPRRQIQSVSVAHEGVHAATGPASDPGEAVAVDADDGTAVGVVLSPVVPPFGCLLGVMLRLEEAKDPEGGFLGVPPVDANGHACDQEKRRVLHSLVCPWLHCDWRLEVQ